MKSFPLNSLEILIHCFLPIFANEKFNVNFFSFLCFLKFETYVLNIKKITLKMYTEEIRMADAFEEDSYAEEPLILEQSESCPACIGKR